MSKYPHECLHVDCREDLIEHQSWKELLWDEKQPCEIGFLKSNNIKVINLRGKLWLGAWLLW